MKYIVLFPFQMIGDLWAKRELIVHFTWREFVGRYRGAHLGLALSFVSPLFLLGIYTLVFGSLYRSSRTDTEGAGSFAIVLFSALIFNNFMNDGVGRASKLLVENPNYITKVVFPVEILPVSLVGSALLHFFVNVLILMGGILISPQPWHWTVFLFPVVIFPLVLITLGACWFLAAVGVYFRDVASFVPPLMMALLFVSAVFFPVSSIPEAYQSWLLLNPMACFSEMGRAIFTKGEMPPMGMWGYCLGIGIFCFFGGYAVFHRLKRGFSDAL
jgi:lipopolysaccharide transport system permease protein